MNSESETPVPPRRSIAFQVLRSAYSSGPIDHASDARRQAVHKYIGVLFKAIVLLIALAMMLPLVYLFYRAAGVGWTEVSGLLGRTRILQIMWNSLLLTCSVTRRCHSRWLCRLPG